MNSAFKKPLIIIAFICAIPLVILLLVYITPIPPYAEVVKARKTLSKAGQTKADTYSKELFAEAKSLYDSAMVSWQKENLRFIFVREYSRVEKFAKLSIKKAIQAKENSKLSSFSYKKKLKTKVNYLNSLAKDINTFFNRYPLSTDVRNKIASGKMLLREGEICYRKGEFIPANRKLNDCEDLLSSAYDIAYYDLENYFKAYSQWEKWTKTAINESKRNQSYSIIVDKLSKKCIIYHNGIKKHEFDVELGRNWVGDKLKRGDKATPEGMYRIVSKLSRTKYNNALLIDYPNFEDKEKFHQAQSRGIIPKTAKIGGGIEIHGSGGKGVDWTEGCIALKDKEMEIVYNLASVGTPVTIVGSIRKLQQVFTR